MWVKIPVVVSHNLWHLLTADSQAYTWQFIAGALHILIHFIPFHHILVYSNQILSILSILHEASWFQNANSLFTFCLSGVSVFFTKIKVARGVAEAAWPQAPSATTFDNSAFRMRSWWPSWVPWHGGLVADSLWQRAVCSNVFWWHVLGGPSNFTSCASSHA